MPGVLSEPIRQRFDFAVGDVVGNIFYRTNGYGGALQAAAGERVPLVHLIGQEPARRRGRPSHLPHSNRKPVTAHQHSAYGLDAAGRWWNVLYTAGEEARGRSLRRPPYAFLSAGRGMRRDYGPQAYLAPKAREALDAAHVAQLQARCPLI